MQEPSRKPLSVSRLPDERHDLLDREPLALHGEILLHRILPKTHSQTGFTFGELIRSACESCGLHAGLSAVADPSGVSNSVSRGFF